MRFEDNKPYSEEIIDTLFPATRSFAAEESNVGPLATRSREHVAWELKAAIHRSFAEIGRTQEDKQCEHMRWKTPDRAGWLIIAGRRTRGRSMTRRQSFFHLARTRSAGAGRPQQRANASTGLSLPRTERRERRLRAFMRYAVILGAGISPRTWVRSQLVRMPDGTRGNGNLQAVYFFFNPEIVK